MRMGCSPRSRVFLTLVPILFLLFVTYPYFSSFPRPSRSPPFLQTPFHENVQSGYPSFDSDLNGHPLKETTDKSGSRIHHTPDKVDPLIFDSDLNNKVVPSGLVQEEPTPTRASVPPPPPTKKPHSHKTDNSPDPFPYPETFGSHPIDGLIKNGIKEFEKLKKKETRNLEEAAAAYRKRRGRHPPPGFDAWYGYAKSKDSIMIEEFFDAIYEDTELFWAQEPSVLRGLARKWSNVVTIRNGRVRALGASKEGSVDWIGAWANMLEIVGPYLPDVDLPFNNLDEPRVVLPWKDIDNYVKKARQHKAQHKDQQRLENISNHYQSLEPLHKDDLPRQTVDAWQNWHKKTPYWHFVREACHPNSPAHGTELASNFSLPPEFPQVFAEESRQGFVANWTFAKNVCYNPHLRNMHGNFVELRFVSVANSTLFPIFSGSKHEGVNNDIRVPAAKYWTSQALFGGDRDVSTFDKNQTARLDKLEPAVPWNSKASIVYWRGAATGGEHEKGNWRAFQRHRLISMMNSTQVEMTERKLENITSLSGPDLLATKPSLPHNFPYPNTRLHPLTAMSTNPTKLGSWLANITDGGFTHMMCHPQGIAQMTSGQKCGYLDPFYHVLPHAAFNTSYKHKYLPDIDGNGYSGRYRAFLRSKSLPIKATVHSEWHDSRIIPWAHFVPMDNTFSDFYSLLEYFAGNPDSDAGGGGLASFFLEWFSWASGGHDGGGSHSHTVSSNGHDDMARAIAEQGKDWADKVLRKEDMVIYMHRLALEWARITNDERDRLGWAEDLVDEEDPSNDTDSDQTSTDKHQHDSPAEPDKKLETSNNAETEESPGERQHHQKEEEAEEAGHDEDLKENQTEDQKPSQDQEPSEAKVVTENGKDATKEEEVEQDEDTKHGLDGDLQTRDMSIERTRMGSKVSIERLTKMERRRRRND